MTTYREIQVIRMNRKRMIASLVTLALIGGAAFAAWSLLLRPISVQVAQVEPSVAVEVFGLGT